MNEADIINWFMVFLRAGALFAVFPVFASPNYPVQLRIALAAFTSFLIMPMVDNTLPPDMNFLEIFGCMITEVLIGAFLGFMSRMVFYSLEFAGALISTQMGIMMSSDMDPVHHVRTQTPGVVLYLLAGMLFFCLNMHHWILIGFRRSFQLVPVGGAGVSNNLVLEVIHQSTFVFSVAVQIAAPMVAVSFLVTLIFGILGRAIPQMNVFMESFAFRVLGGMIVFGLTVSVMAQYIMNFFNRLPEDFLRIAHLMGAG
ncbi:MAG: flagellar biosynthetic protein FliR [Verrucomicrobia bacterium]|nr:flagellar biosynthetic protein FliR [Verrucomicrobiota bacterium]MCF7707909.1 flagellar biosynthetic protein FliR [Verrucomicrobiota bacterium]